MTIIEKLLPCPFCGWGPDGALRTFDLGPVLNHPKRECPLSGLWFKVPLWNARPEAAEKMKGLVEAGGKLLTRWDEFSEEWGNQADAYYQLAKNAQDDWKELRTALRNISGGDE